MKKYFYLLLLAMMPILLISCGGDDEDESSNTPDSGVMSAKVGDIYYSDGTCSRNYVSGKTPIGIVVYVGTDAVSENMQGLVMALHDAGKEEWYYNNEFISNNEIPIVSTMEGLIADMGGVKKTLILKAHKYKAATCIENYPTSAPSGTSGWFLPSAGQWIAVLNEYGAGITKDTQLNVFTGGAQVLENINKALSKVGEEGTDYTEIGHKYGTGQDNYYWTSSKSYGGVNSYSPVDIVFSLKNGVKVGNSGSYLSSLFIRPFLAF